MYYKEWGMGGERVGRDDWNWGARGVKWKPDAVETP